MTTEELIAILEQHPGKRVVIDGYEGGLNDIEPSNVRSEWILLNRNTPNGLFGVYDWPSIGHSREADEEALYIPRPY